MQTRVYNLNTPWTDIQFIPEYKLSLWYGFGSDGKSALCEYLVHNSCKDFTYVGVNIPSYETDKIVIIDEDSLSVGSVIDNIKNSPNTFVILARSITRVLNIPYRAIYIVKNLEATAFNVCRFTVERFFKDYNYLPKNYIDSIELFAKSKNLSRDEAIDYLLTLAPEVRLADKSDEDIANDVLRIIGFN